MSQHTKLILEKKLSHRSCRDSNSQLFDHKSSTLTNKLSWFSYDYNARRAFQFIDDPEPETLTGLSLVQGSADGLTSVGSWSER